MVLSREAELKYKLALQEAKEAAKEKKILEFYNKPNPYRWGAKEGEGPSDPSVLSKSEMRKMGLMPETEEEKYIKEFKRAVKLAKKKDDILIELGQPDIKKWSPIEKPISEKRKKYLELTKELQKPKSESLIWSDDSRNMVKSMLKPKIFSNLPKKRVFSDIFSKNMELTAEEQKELDEIKGKTRKSKPGGDITSGGEFIDIEKLTKPETLKVEPEKFKENIEKIEKVGKVETYETTPIKLETYNDPTIREILREEVKNIGKKVAKTPEKTLDFVRGAGTAAQGVAEAWERMGQYKRFEDEKKLVREANTLKLKMAKLKQENYVRIQEENKRKQLERLRGQRIGGLGPARPAGLIMGNPLGGSTSIPLERRGFANPLDTGKPIISRERFGNPLGGTTSYIPVQTITQVKPKKFTFHGMSINSDNISKNMAFNSDTKLNSFSSREKPRMNINKQVPLISKRQYIKSGMFDPNINPDFKPKVQYRSVRVLNKKSGEWEIIKIPKERELSAFEKIDKNMEL